MDRDMPRMVMNAIASRETNAQVLALQRRRARSYASRPMPRMRRKAHPDEYAHTPKSVYTLHDLVPDWSAVLPRIAAIGAQCAAVDFNTGW